MAWLTRRALGLGAAGLAAAGLLRPGRTAAQGTAPAIPVQTPILLPDTGMHVGAVRAVAVAANGSFIATGGADRTLRVWDGRTGRLLRKLHPPLGEGSIGVVDAVALSPDGRRALVSSLDFAGSGPARPGILYLFDLWTGRLAGGSRGRPGFAARFAQLAMAPDGASYAAAVGADGLLIRTEGNAPLFDEPVNAADPVVAVAAAPDGRFACASRLGVVRVFRREGARAAERLRLRLPAGGEPLTLAFSPDGTRLAVGYANRPFVHVVDAAAAAGAPLRLDPPGGVSAGNLGAVAWGGGEDGQPWLFAGGTIQDVNQSNILLAWRGGRAGAPLMLGVASDSIAQLAPHALGGVVFGSSDPAWGRVQVRADGRRLDLLVAQRSERLDFRNVTRTRWGISADGATVEFQGRGQAALRFGLDALGLEGQAVVPRPDLHRPRPAVPQAQPGEAAVLLRGERVHARDATADGRRHVLGTDERLVLLDGAGREVASRAVATPAWGVAVARDRPVVAAAHGDGTIRWYSLDERLPLAELGGLFVHADRAQWVAWRADARFAHSDTGGPALAGFHQNGRPGDLTGRWLSFSQAYRRLYDPEGVRRLLEADWASISAPAELDAALDPLRPPRVRLRRACPAEASPPETVAARTLALLTEAPVGDAPAPTVPADAACQEVDETAHTALLLPPGTPAARLWVELEPGAGGEAVTVADVLVNGRNAGRRSLPPGSPPLLDLVVPLVEGENTVEVRAYDATGVFGRSVPVALTVPTRALPAQPAGRPLLQVLAAGVDRYRGINPLQFAVADARSFCDDVRRLMPRSYAGTEVTLLTDEEATLPALLDALARLSARTRAEDGVLVYLSGHGTSPPDGSYVFVTADVHSAAAVNAGRAGLNSRALVQALGELRSTRAIVFLDTCHAGAFQPQGPGNLAHESGRYVLTAATRLQVALDSYDGVNGVFARAVREGLAGEALSIRGEVDALQLGQYVRDRVPELARRRGHFQQQAVFKASGDLLPFPIAQPG